MNRIPHKWILPPDIPQEVDQELIDFPPIMRKVFFNRGLFSLDLVNKFIKADYPPNTSPGNLQGVSEAAERINYAIDHQENIVIYGDYDADGVTATALLVRQIRCLGGHAKAYIPNRFEEGYGLNIEALQSIKDDGGDLVITVDCGIRSVDEAAFARHIGLDIIISDHHHPGPEIPDAVSVIDPKLPGDPYPEKHIAGVTIAYKISEAIFQQRKLNRCHAADNLDIVAIGTVADLAPLTGENRSLVRDGVKLLRNTTKQGLWSLMQIARVSPERIRASDIGFSLGPRLNAAGRLDTAFDAYQLLVSDDLQEVGLLAQKLDSQNRERQRITRDIQQKASELALTEEEPLLLFAAHQDFNPGVVGLASSKLTESYYRPSIVAFIGEKFTRASCRSIPEFHITNALDQCADILVQHGGHAAAAGFTIENSRLRELQERLKQIALEELSELDLRPSLPADGVLPLSDLKPELIQYQNLLEPTGYGNPEPLYISRDVKISSKRLVGSDSKHLKLSLSDGWITYDAIAFNLGYWNDVLPERIDIAYHYEVNHYNGYDRLQLRVKDIKPSGLS